MLHKSRLSIRLFVVFVFFASSFSVITIRLYVLQITHRNLFKDLATDQYNVKITHHSPRGIIYDRTGKTPLAINYESTSAFFFPGRITTSNNTRTFLAKHFPSAWEYHRLHPEKTFVWIKRNLSPDELSLLEDANLSEVHFVKEPRRYYPVDAASSIVGKTNIDNVGISGIEFWLNEHLRGEVTALNLQHDARSTDSYFTQKAYECEKEGESVVLSLDATLQFIASEELLARILEFNAKGGGVVILNPDTGEILACVSHEIPKISPPQALATIHHTTPITESFELGSVIKTFCALAALEEEAVTPDEIIDCEGAHYSFGSYKVTNPKPLGSMPFRDVMLYSSNVGLAKVSQRMGKKLWNYYDKLGFGKKCGIEFPGEQAGLLRTVDKWSGTSNIALSFGYEMRTTLIQLARAMGIIANGGYDVQPTFFKRLCSCPKEEALFRPETIATIQEILERIARNYTPKGYRAMGKTGTARIWEKGGYSEERHLYTFAGILEKDDFKRVIVTFIKEPQNPNLWATRVTAPLFKKIAERTAAHEHLTSTT